MRTATPEPKMDVIYRSGTSDGLGAGWDVMLVIYRKEDGGQMRIANSFAIARDASGKIIRKIDSFPEQWEVINDAEDLRGFRECFRERDSLPDGQVISIRNVCASVQEPVWEVGKHQKGQETRWTGSFKTAEEALAHLQEEIDTVDFADVAEV